MNIGYLTVILRMASGALPAANMKVQIKGASGNVLYDLTTGADGSTEQVALETAEETFGLGRHPIGFYDVEIPPSGGLSALSIKGVEVYEGVASVLPVTVTSFTGEDMSKNIFLPKEHGADWRSAVETQAIPGPDDYPAGTHATAPLTIVIHMGYYRDTAENVQVPFLDYLKNIASNEAYADWDRGSLYATVYCLSTFALNRVFTEWYRNQGYPFDITSDPRSDPIYQEGRPIPSNIFQIAELLLNVFISRKDSIAPIFPIYGGGPLPCAGFSMQEALQMSSKGYSPLDILKHFFGKGLNLQEADLPSSMLENPGASGEGIKRIRSCLNDLRISYPSIPEIKPENGKFGDDTKEAIAEFQRIFRLTVSGVLTPATQSQLGVVGESLRSLKRLLKERSSLKLEEPPDDKLSYGMDPAAQSGSVLILHHILNFLSLFNPAIPGVSEDIFGYETEESVAAFQRAFKISEAGAVGEATWPKLFEEYSSLQDSILDLGEEPDIPAFPDLQAKPDLPHEDQSAANQGGLQDKAQEQIMLDPAAPVGKPTPAAKSIGNSHEIRPPNISAKQRQYIDSVLYPGSAGFLKELGKAEQAEKPETAAPKPKLAFAPKSQAITLLLLFLLVNSRGNSAFSQNSAKRP